MNSISSSNYYEIVAAFVVALVLTLFFTTVLRTRGPWGSWWLVFIVIFLSAWAAHLWINPIGPMVLGVSIVPIFIVGLIFAFVLAASSIPVVTSAKNGDTTTGDPGATAISIFFWILVLILVVAIASGYFKLPPENSKQLVK